MQPQLKLYVGDEEPYDPTDSLVSVPLGELARVIGDAARFQRTWLNDFEDEEVQVSSDLYELISAYWQLRPGA